MINIKARTDSNQDSDPLFQTVMQFLTVIKQVFDQGKQPGFTAASWASLAELVAVDEFEWSGPFCERLNWQEYADFLTQWATTVSWVTTFHRIHVWQRTVYAEYEDQSTIDDMIDISNSMSVFDFNQAGKIRRLAIYLQRRHSLGV